MACVSQGREALRRLRHCLWAQGLGHRTLVHLEDGNARRFSLKGRERYSVSQINFKAVLECVCVGGGGGGGGAAKKRLRDGVERIWAFPRA